jgi:hypothetical protein
MQKIIARILVDALTPEESDGEDDEDSAWSVWDPPSSSAIAQVKHRLRDGMMTVRFRKTKFYPDYLFLDVPRVVFRDWKRRKSAGGYYHRQIKNQGYNVS